MQGGTGSPEWEPGKEPASTLTAPKKWVKKPSADSADTARDGEEPRNSCYSKEVMLRVFLEMQDGCDGSSRSTTNGCLDGSASEEGTSEASDYMASPAALPRTQRIPSSVREDDEAEAAAGPEEEVDGMVSIVLPPSAVPEDPQWSPRAHEAASEANTAAAVSSGRKPGCSSSPTVGSAGAPVSGGVLEAADPSAEGGKKGRNRRRRDRNKSSDLVASPSPQATPHSTPVTGPAKSPKVSLPSSPALPPTKERSQSSTVAESSPPSAVPVVDPSFCGTLMLRDIPNKYTRDMLLDCLNKDFKGAFDFLYMPIDFRNRCNVGYAFINFKETKACQRFVSAFHGVNATKCLPGFNSSKVCHVTPARVQGAEANVAHLRQSNIVEQLTAHPEWQPLIFGDDGVPFAFLTAEGGQAHSSRKSRRRAASDSVTGAVGTISAAPTAAEKSGSAKVRGRTLSMATETPHAPAVSAAAPLAAKDPPAPTKVAAGPSVEGVVEPSPPSKTAATVSVESSGISLFEKAKDAPVFRMPAWDAGGPSSAAQDGVTAMLRGIPNTFTREALFLALDAKFRRAFDFLYLPVDFDTGVAMGYGFINFKDEASYQRFVAEFDGADGHAAFGLTVVDVVSGDVTTACSAGGGISGSPPARVGPKPRPSSRLRVTYAREQGLAANVRHWCSSNMARDVSASSDMQPLLLDHSGIPAPLSTWAAMLPYNLCDGWVEAAAAEVEATLAMQAACWSPLRQQVEYYFSEENLDRDFYLRTHMDEEGWVPMITIADFPKVQQVLYYADLVDRLDMLVAEFADMPSAVVEMDQAASRLRIRDPQLRAEWPRIKI
eukprot:TRINITY_DN38390_c0_g1_i1.p1 TRINITY_DN38390_c0_g1~~TRINITY_DN38390_c0_g1_i1.p1  ORF type:complete len:880 (-),score=187.55 TRINITY_DN38390_c0_g1_i1:153-2642(-)